MSVATQTQTETPTATEADANQLTVDTTDETDDSDGVLSLSHWKNAARSKMQDYYEEGDKITDHSSMNQMGGGAIDRIIGAGVTIAIGAVILNFVLTMDIVANSTGPLGDFLGGTLPDTLVAALTFAVLGLIALAGGMALRMLRGGF